MDKNTEYFRDLTPNQRYKLKYRYNMTPQEYHDRLDSQDSKCLVCQRSDRVLSIDHDHDCCPGRRSCGECIRGFICNPCNVALGMFTNSIDTLYRAIDYLGSDTLPAHAVKISDIS